MAFCGKCGHQIHPTDAICPQCGAVQHAKPIKKQTVALVLASTLGLFGIHRFYLGQRLSGLVYLLFCWTGIPALLALIESIIYACTSPQKWADRYNEGRVGAAVPKVLAILTVVLPILFLALFIVSLLFPDLDL